MTPVGISKARHRLGELVSRAARGEEIVITRRGEPVARLVPAQTEAETQARTPNAQGQARALAERIRRSRTGQTLGDGASIRQRVEEGRR